MRDRQPSVIDGHEKTSEYQRPRLRFHPYVRPTRPSLRPDLPFPPRSSEWRSRMAAKATALAARSVLEGRSLLRDPRRRRGVSGALPSSASGRPYRRWEAEAGSTSNSAIVIPSNNVIVLIGSSRQIPTRLASTILSRNVPRPALARALARATRLPLVSPSLRLLRPHRFSNDACWDLRVRDAWRAEHDFWIEGDCISLPSGHHREARSSCQSTFANSDGSTTSAN